MLRKFLLRLKAKHVEALREQRGQSIIIFTFAFLGLVAMLGLALDLGLVYIERVKVGRTTDAATLASVSELSSNNEQATMDRAVEYIRLNGYEVGNDTEILVRGCMAVPPIGYSQPGNYYEKGLWPSTSTTAMPYTNTITGALYIPAVTNPPRATFVIDTGSYQVNWKDCNPTANPASFGGSPQKVHVFGKVNVHMSFMQFFGFSDVPVADEAIAENLTTLDVVIVFDISGSMEDQTVCHDCWVRTTYDTAAFPYPTNGYFNPIPYDPKLAPTAPNQSVPKSKLCTDPPTPWLQANGATTYKYLTLEAELYSANFGDWNLTARKAGQGFWAIQRGSRGSVLPAGIDTNENNNYQGNQAGVPDNQSSNVCGPALPDGINCKVNGDDVCKDDPGNDIFRDCSAYIAARPYQTYGQAPGNIPNLNGGSYNLDCFSPGTGPFSPTVLSHACWSNVRTGNENPFFAQTGPLQLDPPWVEYDFTPSWTGNTYIWIRAMGGGENSYMWRGPSPDDIGAVPPNWRKVVFWQINQGEVFIQNDNANANVKQFFDVAGDKWRTNRAEPDLWRWVKLGSTTVASGTQATFKLYQGSSGYMVDKVVFTNDPGGSSGSPPPAMRLKRDTTTIASGDGREAVGPPASYGSATREACNVCNPIYGNKVSLADCSCLKNNTEASKRYLSTYPGFDPAFYGTGGDSCSEVQPGVTLNMVYNDYLITVSPPEVQPPQIQTRTIISDLYSPNQPIRSAQEAVKNFLLGNGVEEKYRLKPGFDQVGFVSFTTNVVNGTGGSSRAKLQCLRTQNPVPTEASTCYAKVLSAVEHQWPNVGTNIAEGMREGLEELGVDVAANTGVDHTCTTGVDDKHACDRRGAAKRVIILLTDGSPNQMITGCASQPGYGDFWDGLVGATKAEFDCAMWYAKQAADKNVIVYTIGIGGGANADFLETMATGVDPRSGGQSVTMFPGAGGKYFPAVRPEDLDGIFRQILTNISVRIVG